MPGRKYGSTGEKKELSNTGFIKLNVCDYREEEEKEKNRWLGKRF